jgi:peptidoglycan/xylan/chitin deacetylase (PgdA/CDA1 family)
MKEIFLTFHGVGEPPPGTDAAEQKFWLEEKAFLSALDVICTATSSLASAVRVTFDDGNTSDVDIALPALLKRGLTASFFLCAGRIGTPDYLDRLAIRDLLSAGMAIGSHGMHHADWRNVNDAELDAEIAGARRKLEDVGGREVDEVSIPFGSYDRRVLAKLRSESFRRAYTSDGGIARCGSWLKARNTLDRSWQRKNILEELAARDSLVRRLRRVLAGKYKALR